MVFLPIVIFRHTNKKQKNFKHKKTNALITLTLHRSYRLINVINEIIEREKCS